MQKCLSVPPTLIWKVYSDFEKPCVTCEVFPPWAKPPASYVDVDVHGLNLHSQAPKNENTDP